MAEAGVDAIVSLGSNLEPERHLPRAIRLLGELTPILAVSSAWATKPVGPPGQPAFVNAAVRLATSLPASRLRQEVLRLVEARLGRRRTANRFAARSIDLDLATYDEAELTLDGRQIPDPDLLRYAHVAVPASEVAPLWVHPASGETLSAIAERLLASLPADARPRRLELSLA